MKDYLSLIMWLLSLAGAAVLACYLAYASTVIQDLKRIFGLAEEQQLPKWKKWFKPIGWLIGEFKDLINCPMCTSFWIGLTINLTLWHITLPFSIIYACLTIVFVEIYRKITL